MLVLCGACSASYPLGEESLDYKPAVTTTFALVVVLCSVCLRFRDVAADGFRGGDGDWGASPA